MEQFDAQGFVVLPSLVDAETLARVRAETDRFEDETATFLASVDSGRIAIAESGAITFTTHLVARSEALRALSLHPTIAGICADLVGPDVNLYWDQAVYKKPEKPRRFPWHQDNGYAFVEPQQYLTCGWRSPTPRSPTAARWWRPGSTGSARSPTPTSTRWGGSACATPTARWRPRSPPAARSCSRR